MTAAVSPSMIPVAGAPFVRPLTNGDGVRLYGSLSGYVGFKPAAAAGSTDYTLPSADGTSGQVLSTNGSGVLSWATASGASPGGSGSELQCRSGASAFGAVAGSSTANGGIALALQSASQVGMSITLASNPSGNAINVTSYGGTAGDILAIDKNGAIRRTAPGSSLVFSTRNSVNNFTSTWTIDENGRLISSSAYGGNVELAGNYGIICFGSAAWRADNGGGALVGGALLFNAATRIAWSGSEWYNTTVTGIAQNSSGVVEINNGTAGTYRDLRARNVILSTSTPASASAAGTTGTVSWDADFVYVCTAANTWKRAALTTW